MLVLMRLCLIMLMRKYKTNRWVPSNLSVHFAYAYVAGVLTCYAYVVLMRYSENHSQLYDCDDLDTSFLRPLRKIIWLQSCEQSSYEIIPCKVRYDHLFVQMNIAIIMWRSRVISLVDLSLSGVHTFVNFLTVVGFTVFPFPFAKRETWNKNQIDYKWTGEIGAGIKIRVYILN